MAQVCDDILVAYPPVGDTRTRRIVELPANVKVTVGLDSEEALQQISKAAEQSRREVGVLIEVDAGAKRVGVQSTQQAIRLGLMARSSEWVRFRGIMFYPGHIRTPREEQGAALEVLAQWLQNLCDTLAEADLAPEIVSGGSTPTLRESHRLPALTEVRAGTCIFNDRDIAAMNVIGWHDLAYSILASVVSVSVPGQAVIDAGSKALSKEPFRSGGQGFGVLLDRPEVKVAGLSEEHGLLDLTESDWQPRVGDRVRVVPNHVCLSVNLQDALLASDSGDFRWIELEGRGRRFQR
jgi:D-serine deaminase-like pyridoxal phosphate-dependent protein